MITIKDRPGATGWAVFFLELAITIAAALGVLIVGLHAGMLTLALVVIAGLFLTLCVVAAPAVSLGTPKARAADVFDGTLAQVILFSVWLGLLVLFVTQLHAVAQAKCPPAATSDLRGAVWFWLSGLSVDPTTLWAGALVALPKIFSFVAALVVSRIDENRLGILLPGAQVGSTSLASNAQNVWTYEATRARLSIHRATQHAGLLGSFTSIALMVAGLVALPNGLLSRTTEVQYGGIAVGTAVGIAFTLELSLALVRTANDDASTRMFARAGRSVVLTLVTSIVASGFLASTLNSGTGALLIGGSCALLGAAAFRAMTDRAGSFLGVKDSRPQNFVDISTVQGLGADDCARLAEEGIDSVHALAFCPTARLFFNTRYSLQRICDWQDQALLLAYVGTSLAAKLREQYLIRGVLDAQFLAAGMLNVQPPEPAADSRSARAAATLVTIRAQAGWEINVAKSLGFSDVATARIALSTLVNDELTDRLRLYWRAATQISAEQDHE